MDFDVLEDELYGYELDAAMDALADIEADEYDDAAEAAWRE